MSERVMVLGAAGMLGHKVVQRLAAGGAEVSAVVRRPWYALPVGARSLLDPSRTLCDVDVADFTALLRHLEHRRPAVVVNCVGVIKQRADAKSAVPSITINALLPHRLAEAIAPWGGRLIHFSTDCVFDGLRGRYTECDVPNATDLYGRTKALGEVTAANALTLRTSIIGRELSMHQSLLDWFLAQNHRTVRGFTKAIYAGVTTPYLADVVARLIAERPDLNGLYQVASDAISKYDLLLLLRDVYRMDVVVEPDEAFFCDRSMLADKFETATGYRCPDWPSLAAQLAADATPYNDWVQK